VTYDQVLQGNGDPQGAELSANVDFPFTVTAGATNDVSVTLGGIPAGLIVTPVTPGYLRGDAHALRLWGPTGQSVFVAAVDADESAIIGTGAPQLTVTSGSSTLGVTTTTAPNVFTLAASTTGSPAVVTPGKVFLSVAASPLSSTGVGGSVTASVPVTIQHSAVYVSILTPNVVDIFYDGNIGTPTVLSAGVPVRGLALDTNGTLYVADNSNNGVSEYRAGTTTQIASLSGSGMSTPYALSLDTNGTLYVANYGGNSVTEYVRDSTTATTTLNDASISGPYGITVDTAGTVYLANFGGNTVTEYTGGATTPGVTLNSASGINGPHGVAVDANGTLYVANFTGNSLAEFAAGSTVATFPVTSGLSGPYGVSVDAAGTLYVVNETTKSVNEYLHGQGAPVVTIPTGDLTGTPLFVAAYPGAIVP
jgi:streptogramin lyase